MIGLKNGKKGVIYLDGKLRIDFKYDDLISFEEVEFLTTVGRSFVNPIIAIKAGKCGVIDLDGQEILPFNYDSLQYLNRFLVCKNGTV